MSAFVFQGDRQLTEVAVLAVDAQAALACGEDWQAKVSALIEQLVEIAGLEWWFTIHDTPQEAEETRRELLAHRDYLNGALFVAAGAAGDRVEWLLAKKGSPLSRALELQRQAATQRLKELVVVVKFLLEDDDPTGDVERTFAIPMPPPQPDVPSVDFDFN
ncbi:MAG: hypothetical protein ABI548_02050 [Polyangiaceae bacterium]